MMWSSIGLFQMKKVRMQSQSAAAVHNNNNNMCSMR